MTDQTLSIFEDETAVPETAEAPEVEEQVEAEPEEQAEAPEQPESGTGEEEATPPVAEPPKQDEAEGRLAAMLDERDKRQAAERRAEAAEATTKRLEAQMQAFQAQQAQKPAPDWFDDPQAAAQYHMQPLEKRLDNRFLNMSEHYAAERHGAKVVEEAKQFILQNPHLREQVMRHPSPYEAVVSQYKQHQFLTEVGSDPDAWRASEKERIRAELVAEMQSQQPQQPVKPAAPPPSLSSAPAGGKPNAAAVATPAHLSRLFND